MPDLITLAIPAFVALLIAEAIAGAVMQRDVYEFKGAAWTAPGWGNKQRYIFGNPGRRHNQATGA